MLGFLGLKVGLKLKVKVRARARRCQWGFGPLITMLIYSSQPHAQIANVQV